MKILITGATGLVGKELGKALTREGHELVVVSRNREQAPWQCPFPCEVIEGDLSRASLKSPLLEGVDAVVHLMGESIAGGRWTEEKKKRLVETRVQATRNLRESFRVSPPVLVSASATGFYGDRDDEVLAEEAASGRDFLAGLCQDWEREAQAFEPQGTRVVRLRFGMVLSHRGGALEEMLPPARAGVAGPLGHGRQWMSWIHLDDLVALIQKSLSDSAMTGVYNAVSPNPVRNREFMKTLTTILRRPGFIPVPSFALKALFGEMSTILLSSQRVEPRRTLAAGFRFRFPELSAALQDQLGHLAQGEDLLVADQYIDLPPEELFPFFAEADNLGRLTPPFLDFKILSVSDPDVREGTLINYRLKVHGLPIRWKTRIEEWRPNERFVDNQLSGPYQLWHHTHSFERLGRGTLMTDRVRYRLPMGFFGSLVAGGFVRGDIEKIFAYRREVIGRLYGRDEKKK